MIQITLEEYVNGYSLVGTDSKATHPKPWKFLDEIAEERLDALRAIDRWVNDEIIKELQGRQQHAERQA